MAAFCHLNTDTGEVDMPENTRPQLSRAEREARAKRRRQKKIKKYIRFFAAWGLLLAVIIVAIVLIVSCAKKRKPAGRPVDEQTTTESAAGEEIGTEAETESARPSGPQLDGSTDPNGNVTSIKLHNEQISLDGLSTNILQWGGSGEPDENGQPIWSVQYQKQYGDMSAYFIGPWEPGDPKVIYLTMDEGYENGYTPTILDTLKEKNVKCVFFMTLPFVEENPDLVQRMIDEGHELANHSVTHPASGIPSQSVEEQTKEVMDVHNYVLEHFGYEMHLFRYPSGLFSEQSLAVVNNCNYRSVLWSFYHYDYNTNEQPDVAESLKYAVDSLHPGAIYLLHAVSSTNTTMLGDFIDQTRAAGYEFELLQ